MPRSGRGSKDTGNPCGDYECGQKLASTRHCSFLLSFLCDRPPGGLAPSTHPRHDSDALTVVGRMGSTTRKMGNQANNSPGALAACGDSCWFAHEPKYGGGGLVRVFAGAWDDGG